MRVGGATDEVPGAPPRRDLNLPAPAPPPPCHCQCATAATAAPLLRHSHSPDTSVIMLLSRLSSCKQWRRRQWRRRGRRRRHVEIVGASTQTHRTKCLHRSCLAHPALPGWLAPRFLLGHLKRSPAPSWVPIRWQLRTHVHTFQLPATPAPPVGRRIYNRSGLLVGLAHRARLTPCPPPPPPPPPDDSLQRRPVSMGSGIQPPSTPVPPPGPAPNNSSTTATYCTSKGSAI